MPVILTPETVKRIEQRLQQGGYASADEVVREALELLEREMKLDDETLDAIDRAEDAVDRGEFVDWKDASAALRSKYLP